MEKFDKKAKRTGTHDIRMKERLGKCEIKIGEFSEEFAVAITYWKKENYLRSWFDTCHVLYEKNQNSTCFITDMPNPKHAEFIGTWPIYRKANQLIVSQQLVGLDQLKTPFNEKKPWLSLREKDEYFKDEEEEDEISEWRITEIALKGFFEMLKLQIS